MNQASKSLASDLTKIAMGEMQSDQVLRDGVARLEALRDQHNDSESEITKRRIDQALAHCKLALHGIHDAHHKLQDAAALIALVDGLDQKGEVLAEIPSQLETSNDAQQALITQYLHSRGVKGFEFGYGRYGATGPEITIENCTPEMSKLLNEACSDALISRGGGGMGASHAYRQIDPEAFSDPQDRALNMLTEFEEKGMLPLHNSFKLYMDDDSNLLGLSGAVVYKADAKTKKMQAWIQEKQTFASSVCKQMFDDVKEREAAWRRESTQASRYAQVHATDIWARAVTLQLEALNTDYEVPEYGQKHFAGLRPLYPELSMVSDGTLYYQYVVGYLSECCGIDEECSRIEGWTASRDDDFLFYLLGRASKCQLGRALWMSDEQVKEEEIRQWGACGLLDPIYPFRPSTTKEMGQWVAFALLRGDALIDALEFGRAAAMYGSAIARLAQRIDDAMGFLQEDKIATELDGRAITTTLEMFTLLRNSSFIPVITAEQNIADFSAGTRPDAQPIYALNCETAAPENSMPVNKDPRCKTPMSAKIQAEDSPNMGM